jgi:hypothetical protein
LHVAGRGDALGDLCGALRCLAVRQLGAGDGEDFDLEVHAVQQRTGETSKIATARGRRTDAVQPTAARHAARARVRGEDELEPCREARCSTGSLDDELAVLQWLTQRLQHAGLELRRLVEEEDSAVGT